MQHRSDSAVDTAPDTEVQDPGSFARRRFLRRGALSAAAAIAGTAAVAAPAAATDNSSLLIGAANDANNTGSTRTTLSGSQLRATNGNQTGSDAMPVSLVGEHTSDGAVGVEGRSTNGAQLRLKPNALDLFADTTHSFAEGSLVADSNQILWYCWGDGTGQDAGLAPVSIIPAFLPLARPARVYDSRPGEPPSEGLKQPIVGNLGEERLLHLVNAQLDVLAVLMNVTVVSTTGTGFLALFAGNTPWDPGQPFSSINWFTDNQIAANMVVSAVDPASGTINVHAGGAGSTHFIIDVVGAWVIL